MAKKKKPTLSKTLFSLMVAIPTLLGLTKRIGALIKLEARLAKRGLFSIVIFALISALLLTASWLCVLAILFIYLSSLQWSTLNILIILLGINIFMLIITFSFVRKYQRRLSFPETRHMLRDIYSIYEDM